MAIKLNYIYCSNPVTELIKYPVTRFCRFSLGLSIASILYRVPFCVESDSCTQPAAKDKVQHRKGADTQRAAERKKCSRMIQWRARATAVEWVWYADMSMSTWLFGLVFEMCVWNFLLTISPTTLCQCADVLMCARAKWLLQNSLVKVSGFRFFCLTRRH